MDRHIIYDQAQGRDYDILHGWRSALYALGKLVSGLLGTTSTMAAGFAATPTGPTSLTINVAAGEIYELANVDTTTFGSLAADTNQIMQQGYAAAQQFTFDMTGLTNGHSRWALVQATFTQTDDIPADDPNGGLLNYINAENPLGPAWSGPGNSGQNQNTRRKGVATLSVIYGTIASTGTEIPPNPQSGNVPLYLVNLAFGQTTIASNQILVAGPSVGVNVPSNYTQAPFLAGQLNSHHSGGAGQAPKIDLTKEVQGVLPAGNLPSMRTQLTANTTFYVATTGNDTTGNGTLGSPWRTAQKASDTLQKLYDLAGYTATIMRAAGSYTDGVIVNGPYVGAIGPGSVIFDGASAASVTVTGNSCYTAAAGAQFTVQNQTVVASGGIGRALVAASGGILCFGTVIFGAADNAQIAPSDGGLIQAVGNYTINGSSANHISSSGNFEGSGVTVTVSGTPAFSNAFATAGLGGLVNMTGATFSGSATGPRYSAQQNGVINTGSGGASYFPGNSSGSTATGGQYT